ncbi:hypothetical protein MOQ72_00135 [Saccharopolyspora sp. K220]|uniref:hypothetical protein n=1 Tax=Saccharopolyspora soli TaxID=2926618 RepID=UPI001F569E57|nr:hypothetical protein [Saccharopolyspora soli]MCI2415817.1 hypothetical protein [Saccharopolyspora soli]
MNATTARSGRNSAAGLWWSTADGSPLASSASRGVRFASAIRRRALITSLTNEPAAPAAMATSAPTDNCQKGDHASGGFCDAIAPATIINRKNSARRPYPSDFMATMIAHQDHALQCLHRNPRSPEPQVGNHRESSRCAPGEAAKLVMLQPRLVIFAAGRLSILC